MKLSTLERFGVAIAIICSFLCVALAASAFTTTLKIKGEDGKIYIAEIVAYIPVFDDEPKLIRVYDKELDAVGHILQNDMAEFLSGLTITPLHQFDAEKAERYRQRMLNLEKRGEIK